MMAGTWVVLPPEHFSFPRLVLNDSCLGAVREEGGWRGLSFDAQQFFQNKRV